MDSLLNGLLNISLLGIYGLPLNGLLGLLIDGRIAVYGHLLLNIPLLRLLNGVLGV